MKTKGKKYQLTLHKKVLKTGTNFECLLFLQRYQGQSYDYATKYSGYKIELL